MATSMQPLRSAREWRDLWRFTRDPYRAARRPTRVVHVGDVALGGTNPIRIQSMTVADTLDTAACVAEIEALVAAGCEIVRVTAPNRTAAENLAAIQAGLRARGVRVPLVADIHFTPQAALLAAEHVEKVRINPGNYADRKHFKKWEYTDAEYAAELERLEAAFRPLVLRCKERGVAMRIGANHGSLSDRILNRYGDTPLGMVESALEFVRICEAHGYRELVLSMKASDVKIMIAAYRLLAVRMAAEGMDYPFHLGVTEAGAGQAARIKSAIGIGALLHDGIGDTVRVSLTEDSVHEIPVARALADLVAPPPEADAAPVDLAPPPWDPLRYARRRVTPVGTGAARLAADHPPRVEVVVPFPAGLAADAAGAVAWCDALRLRAGGEQGADLVLLALGSVQPDAAGPRALAARATETTPHLGIEIEASSAAILGADAAGWARVAVRVAPESSADCELPAGAVQVTLQAAGAAVADRVAAVSARTAIALEGVGAPPSPQALRRLAACSGDRPLVLRAPAGADPLRVAAALGTLLADGVGDAVQLVCDADSVPAIELGREILQAARLRLSRADFIACPSCGRTQFDLQSTTTRIEAVFRHLRGLKIAVMGCIVNGPGEMADADFGYVGSGPGRIDLYVGQERVERAVSEAEAVGRLVALVRDRGQWIDPPA